MESIITVKDLCKSYGEKLVLDKINLDVAEGEILGFLGPTGAGKTTLIKILTGQTPITSGIAKVLGTECSKLTYKEYYCS